MSSRLPPSPGFLLVIVVFCGTVAFFGWGLTPPRLDGVWQQEIELKLGKRDELKPAELKRFQRVLREHPSYADHLTDGRSGALISANASGVVETGYAYLVRTRPSKNETLRVTLLDKKKKVDVRARTDRGVTEGTATRNDPWIWELPADGRFPELIELTFSDKVPLEVAYSAELGPGSAPRESDDFADDEREEDPAGPKAKGDGS